MAFEPGHEKLGGKVKGSLNKKNQEIQELAKELGCNPAKILMLIMIGDKETLKEEKDIDLDRKMKAAESLMPYLYGKRKPVDSDGDDTDSLLSVFVSALNADK
jgi:hypothetical protein